MREHVSGADEWEPPPPFVPDLRRTLGAWSQVSNVPTRQAYSVRFTPSNG